MVMHKANGKYEQNSNGFLTESLNKFVLLTSLLSTCRQVVTVAAYELCNSLINCILVTQVL